MKPVFSSYNEVDMITGTPRITFYPEEIGAKAMIHIPAIGAYIHQHPLMRRYERGEDEGVIMISDFLGVRELHGLEFYSYGLAPLGIEDTLTFVLSHSRRVKVFFAVNSATRFGERDRALAAALQPHLMQAFDNALAFTDARALALLSERAMTAVTGHGAMLAAWDGSIVHANEQSTEHLDLAFPDAGTAMLPEKMRTWLSENKPDVSCAMRSLEIGAGDTTLIFHASPTGGRHWLIASRVTDRKAQLAALAGTYRLTRRQAEVLLWVSRGKRNSEIAAILGMMPRTVAKHQETLLERLGVENRESAMLLALKVIGSE